jgi:hypothetical protein
VIQMLKWIGTDLNQFVVIWSILWGNGGFQKRTSVVLTDLNVHILKEDLNRLKVVADTLKSIEF